MPQKNRGAFPKEVSADVYDNDWPGVTLARHGRAGSSGEFCPCWGLGSLLWTSRPPWLTIRSVHVSEGEKRHIPMD